MSPKDPASRIGKWWASKTDEEKSSTKGLTLTLVILTGAILTLTFSPVGHFFFE